jgi:hypothetical protein
MSGSIKNNFPALGMAHCPNCDFVIDQLGDRTTCSKCGKQITVRCTTCQTNNPPVFQFCMKCGSDFRLLGVEFYRKQLAKLEFELKEYERLLLLQNRAKSVQSLLFLIIIPATALMALWGQFYLPFSALFMLALFTAMISYFIVRAFGARLAQTIAGVPSAVAKEWRQICRAAEKQQAQKLELEEKLKYYLHELNQFRQKGN